jgi:acyl-CoA thioesterase FadM
LFSIINLIEFDPTLRRVQIVMNLLIRLLCLMTTVRFNSKCSLYEKTHMSFRVWPHDVGMNTHLPSFRYVSFMELGRIALWNRSDQKLSKSYRAKIIAAQNLTYIREIKPFQKFTMDTQLIGFDHKYFYYRHNFFVGKKLCGVGLVKEMNLLEKGHQNPMELLGEKESQIPEVIAKWQKTMEQLKEDSI